MKESIGYKTETEDGDRKIETWTDRDGEKKKNKETETERDRENKHGEKETERWREQDSEREEDRNTGRMWDLPRPSNPALLLAVLPRPLQPYHSLARRRQSHGHIQDSKSQNQKSRKRQNFLLESEMRPIS